MKNFSAMVKQLKKERDSVERHLSALNAAITAFAGVYRVAGKSTKKRRLSAQARAKIAAAQRARWVRFKAKQKGKIAA